MERAFEDDNFIGAATFDRSPLPRKLDCAFVRLGAAVRKENAIEA
jgi:hypothetical protein